MAVFETKIYVDGIEINNLINIKSITIQQSENEIDRAEIIVNEELNTEMQFSTFNSNLFSQGKKISIYVGYRDRSKVTFDGFIALLTIICDSFGNATLTIACNGNNSVVSYPSKKPRIIPSNTTSQLKLNLGENILSFSLQLIAEPVSNRLDWLCGHMEILGSEDAKIKTMVNLNGFGPRLSNDAYIARVKHVFEAGSWITKLDLGRPGKLT